MPESIRFFFKYLADINERHWNVNFADDKQHLILMKIINQKAHKNDDRDLSNFL